MVNMNVPASVGVPEIVPFEEDKLRLLGSWPAMNRPRGGWSPASGLQTGAVRNLHLAAGQARGRDQQGLRRIHVERGRIAGHAARDVADYDGELRTVIR